MMPVLAQRHTVAAQKGKAGKDKKPKGAPEKGKEKQNCADQNNKP